MRASACALIVSAVTVLPASVARAQAVPPPATAAGSEALYLQAFVNGIDREVIVHAERVGRELYVSADDLVELGLDREQLPASPHGVPLGQIHGLRVRYDAQQQLLDLTVPDSLLATQVLTHAVASKVPPHSDSGLVLDYSLNWQGNSMTLPERTGREPAPVVADGFGGLPAETDEQFTRSYEQRNRTLSLATGLRWFAPWGLVQNRGYLTHESDETQYIRDDSFWAYSSPESMRSYLVGDFIGTPLEWTRSLRLGGVRIARNFGLRPDLVTFALPALGGSAVVPTTVDLYVNGMRQFSGQANPGPFVIADAPPLTGAGDVSIVYRDAHGREVVSVQPLYVDTRLLESGLMDYDFEYGYARRNYGSASFDYADDPGALGSLRYGVSDRFTLEAHTELADALQVFGAGGLLSLGTAGVASAAIAHSDADDQGWLTSVGYQYITQRWSLDLYDRRTHGDYRDLGTLENVPVPKRLTRGVLTLWVTSSQALSASYIEQLTSPGDSSSVLTLGYRGTFFDGRFGAYLNAWRDYDEHSDGFYLGFTLGFGSASTAYSSVSRMDEDRTGSFGVSRPVDYDRGGFGWHYTGERGNDDYQRDNASLDYRAGFIDMSLGYQKSSSDGNDTDSLSLYAAGSLVAMRGGVFAARSINDGFALVSTEGLPDIPVLRENRLLGRTNGRGYLLVPDLPSWRASKIAIDLTDAPVDVASEVNEQRTNPRGGSGVNVKFPVRHMSGATLVLVDGAMRPLPPGTRVTLAGSGTKTLVGYDGQAFFAELAPDNHVVAELDDGRCEVEVHFEASQAMKILGPFVCEAK